MPESPGDTPDSDALTSSPGRLPRQLSPSSRVLDLPFLIALALIVVVSTGALISWQRSTRAEAWRRHSTEIVALAQAFRDDISDTQLNIRAYILGGQASTLNQYRSAASAALQDLRRLQDMTIDDPQQQERLAQVSTDANALLAYSRQIIGRQQQGAPDVMQLYASGTRFGLINRNLADLKTFADSEQRLLATRSAVADRESRYDTLLLVAGRGLVAGLLIFCYLRAGRELRGGA